MLQISMDGPNVNLKVSRSLKEEFAASGGSQKMLDIGSCGLHVVNGAFKSGHNVTLAYCSVSSKHLQPFQECSCTSSRLRQAHWKHTFSTEVLLSSLAGEQQGNC
ncbi:hypothetical protein HPB48_025166 [Haemaphysalis longicornis]|uniref:Uncharacterized protein n=1 Tax=Haemaphysalis longicornis TaxID=44386 RepID=A0A9J6H9Z0_HAELO|nr:hypothetical protein HPB48_025166 [Haemaphysalis longicornis]